MRTFPVAQAYARVFLHAGVKAAGSECGQRPFAHITEPRVGQVPELAGAWQGQHEVIKAFFR